MASLLADGDPAAFAVPQVARTAGVSVRTVYRYFPDKESLVQAVAEVDDPAYALGVPASDGADLLPYLRRAWSDDVQQPFLRAQLQTADGQRVRAARRAAQRPYVQQVLEAWTIELDDDSERRLIDLLQLLTGAASLVELVDVLGEEVDEAAAVATWAVEAVLVHARRTGRLPGAGDEHLLDPDAGAPADPNAHRTT